MVGSRFKKNVVREEDIDDPWAVLEIDDDADFEEIKRAFRRRSLETHPDRHGGDDTEFKRVNLAYQMLTRPPEDEEEFEEVDGEEGVWISEEELEDAVQKDVESQFEYVEELLDAGLAEAAETAMEDLDVKLRQLDDLWESDDPRYEGAMERRERLRTQLFKARVWDSEQKIVVGATEQMIGALHEIADAMSTLATAIERTGDPDLFCRLARMTFDYVDQAQSQLNSRVLPEISKRWRTPGKALQRELHTYIGQNMDYYEEKVEEFCSPRSRSRREAPRKSKPKAKGREVSSGRRGRRKSRR